MLRQPANDALRRRVRTAARRFVTMEILMRNKRSTRARTSTLVFAPLLLGTIAVPAVRPARIPASARVRGRRFQTVEPPAVRSNGAMFIELDLRAASRIAAYR